MMSRTVLYMCWVSRPSCALQDACNHTPDSKKEAAAEHAVQEHLNLAASQTTNSN
jgi:hypothetical protein